MSKFSKSEFDALLSRKFVYPSFGIYGGYKGLFDYGPYGTPLMNNIIHWFRKFFVVEENMFELDTVSLTPRPVLKASGHVDRFSDLMTHELDNGRPTGVVFRVDHLIKGVFEERLKDKAFEKDHSTYNTILHQLDNYSKQEFDALLKEHQIQSPTNKSLSDTVAFNLMFGTCLGAESNDTNCFMRPETAQSQFMHFNKLSELKELPISCTIGKSFRNEISPRSGILRVREFLMGEIEHFVDPDVKTHPKFNSVSHIKVTLLDAPTQEKGLDETRHITLGEALDQKIIKSELVGYYLGRVYLFLEFIGIDMSLFRFRQHMCNEMAHYANDCWDAEVKTSYGWIEAIGIADRGCFDLTKHSEATGQSMVYRKKLDPPQQTEQLEVQCQMKVMGKTFRKQVKEVEEALNALDQSALATMKEALEKGTYKLGDFEITKDMVQVEMVKRTIHGACY